MATLGDVLQTTRDFFTLQRTATKPPQRIRNISDPPTSGRYATWHTWSDERQERLALHSSWVFSAIRQITQAAIASHLTVHRMDGEEMEPIANHPLEQLLRSPNLDLSREQLWWHTHFSLQLSGKAFWLMLPDGRGNLAELWPLPHHKVVPVPDDSPNPDSLFSRFDYRLSGGNELSIPRDNIVYLRFIDPFDPYGAMSPLKAAARAMVLDLSQTAWSTKTFDEEGGLPANLISVAQDTDKADIEALKHDLRKNIGKNLVIPAGTLDVQRLGMTTEEADFLSSREFNRDEIYEVYGVPADTGTEAATKEYDRRFINRAVWPLLNYLAGMITTQITKPLYGPNMVAIFEDIRPQDRALAVQEATQYWPVLSVNEARQERDMDPLPSFKVTVGEEEFDLFQDVPIKLLSDVLSKMKGAPDQDFNPALNFQGGNQPINAPSMQDAASPAASQELDDRQALDVEPEEEQQERPATRSISGAYEEWQAVAVKMASRGNAPGRPFVHEDIPLSKSFELATVLGHCRNEAEVKAVFHHLDDYLNIKLLVGEHEEIDPERQALDDEFVPEIETFLQEQSDRVFNQVQLSQEPPDEAWWQKEELLLLAFLIPFMEKWAEAGISLSARALAEVGLGIDAGVNAEAAAWAGREAKALSKGLIKTTKELVKARIRNWRESGQPLAALKNILRQTTAPLWRAQLIAQTEITRAISQSRNFIAPMIGVKKMVWQTMRDERVCPICSPLHGKKKTPGGSYPGGFSGPPAHPRCRCDEAFEF